MSNKEKTLSNIENYNKTFDYDNIYDYNNKYAILIKSPPNPTPATKIL